MSQSRACRVALPVELTGELRRRAQAEGCSLNAIAGRLLAGTLPDAIRDALADVLTGAGLEWETGGPPAEGTAIAARQLLLPQRSATRPGALTPESDGVTAPMIHPDESWATG